jgi:hypothetical protein
LLFVLSHAASRKRKIPVATIGRSLSGGVTGGIVPNIIFGRNEVTRQNRTFADILLSSPVLCGQTNENIRMAERLEIFGNAKQRKTQNKLRCPKVAKC